MPRTDPLPPIGATVGLRYRGERRWIPGTYAGPHPVQGPSGGSIFLPPVTVTDVDAFGYPPDDSWEWRDWAECPQREVRCYPCKGSGKYLDGECPICVGAGTLVAPVPFREVT
jgi:hypothetical protein